MAQWGNTDTLADAPIWADDVTKVIFVDTDEAQIASNRVKGIKTPGWNLHKEYTDQNGNVRRSTESLVAMKATAIQAGDLGVTGDTIAEDAIVADA